jgi:polyhydroxybutyrate depolymerase
VVVSKTVNPLRVGIAILFVTIALACVACGPTDAPGIACDGVNADPECRGIVVNGAQRAFLLHVPATYHAGGALVIALHGVGELGPRLRDVSLLSLKADTEGFAIAYPNATKPANSDIAQWNGFLNASFGTSPPDDIGFLRQLIAELQRELAPDSRRIFVVGLSNGGLMAERVAVELGDKVAAVADVAGTLAEKRDLAAIPTVAVPMSVLLIHGDSDATVPCCALKAATTMDDAFDFFAGARGNDCAVVSTTQPICDGPETPSSLPEKRASSCRAGTEVQFYMLFGGRHGWYQGPLNVAGQEGYNPLFGDSVGTTMNDVIWRFFESHARS